MKYLKYKNKYLILKNQVAGMHHLPMHEHEECGICQEDIDFDNQEVRQCANSLNHMFHRACIEPWLENNTTCPICRLPFHGLPVIPAHQLNRANLLVRFPDLPNLQYIDLDNKQIQNIDSQTFQNLPNLQTLYLGNNQIQIIDPQTFQNLPNLRFLYLRHNQIQIIDPQTFQNLPVLQAIDLTGNPLQNIIQLRASLPLVAITF